MKRINKTIESRIVSLYLTNTKWSSRKIARILELGQTTVLRALKRNKVSVRRQRDYKFKAWNKGKTGVQKHSEETKRKIGLNGFHYGMKGKKHTKKTKQRMSELRKGKKLSLESRKKLSIARKGMRPTAEILKKLSESHKGQRAWNKNLKGFMAGEKSPSWKGGITPVHLQIRHSLEYKLWRESILKRDNYTCQECGSRGGMLQVDHWETPFSEIINIYNIRSLIDAINCKKLWDKNNGRTLCLDCHKKTDTYLVGNRFFKIDQSKVIEKIRTFNNL